MSVSETETLMPVRTDTRCFYYDHETEMEFIRAGISEAGNETACVFQPLTLSGGIKTLTYYLPFPPKGGHPPA